MCENSFAVVGLTAFGTVVKGWNIFKKIHSKWTGSVRLHDLRKDIDQIDKVCAKITSGRI